MSYKSPIEIEFDDVMARITAQIQENNETQIMATVNQFVSVDKEELIKALNYDRQQYDKGYQEGHVDGVLQAEKLYARPISEWVLDSDNLPVCKNCGEVALQRVFVKMPSLIQDVRMVHSNYCPNCGAKKQTTENNY